MCETVPTTYYQTIPTKPETQLRTLIESDLGVSVSADALRVFIRCRWERVAALAHRIHEGK